MDVAEQALTALETLSKKHAKIILQAVSTLMVWAKFAFGPKSQRKSWPEKINVVL